MEALMGQLSFLHMAFQSLQDGSASSLRNTLRYSVQLSQMKADEQQVLLSS